MLSFVFLTFFAPEKISVALGNVPLPHEKVWHVEKHKDLQVDDFRQAVDGFVERVRELIADAPTAIVLLFVSCHGVEHEGDAWLISSSSQSSDGRRVPVRRSFLIFCFYAYAG